MVIVLWLFLALVEIAVRFLRPGVFDVQNIITIPHAKLIRKLGNLTSDQSIDVAVLSINNVGMIRWRSLGFAES